MSHDRYNPNSWPIFSLGDLVRFDFSHKVGIVTGIKRSEDFPDLVEEPCIYEIKVWWIDGEEFWCLDFSLELLARGY